MRCSRRAARQTRDEALRPIAERVRGLDGELSIASTAGWGSTLSIRLPLDPPAQPDGLDVAELSAREREVLNLITLGASNQRIADDLGISGNTAKFHVSNLLRKADARNRAELAALAR